MCTFFFFQGCHFPLLFAQWTRYGKLNHANGILYRFLRGDQYAIALALLDEGTVVLGVLACPNLPLTSIAGGGSHHSLPGEVGCLFFSVAGGGTYMHSLDSSSAVKVSALDILFPDDMYSRGCLWFVSNVFLVSCRCKSALLTILKKLHSLNHMKQHTPCMIYPVLLPKYDHSPCYHNPPSITLPKKEIKKDFSCKILNV